MSEKDNNTVQVQTGDASGHALTILFTRGLEAKGIVSPGTSEEITKILLSNEAGQHEVAPVHEIKKDHHQQALAAVAGLKVDVQYTPQTEYNPAQEKPALPQAPSMPRQWEI